MKKTKLMPLMIGVVVTGLSFSSAHAEFMLGLQGGFASSQGEATTAFGVVEYPILSGEGGGGALGLFGQYRHSLSNNVFLGVHLGYTADSAEWKELDVDGSGLGVADGSSFGYKADYAYDALGLIGYRGQKGSPFMMFGFSNMKVEGSALVVDAGRSSNSKTNATLTGWKLAAGIEFPFSDKLVGHVLLHYADYGKATLTIPANNDIVTTPTTLEVKQTGIRFGIGYRF